MFEYDSDVVVGEIVDEGTIKRIQVEVKNHTKYEALTKVLNTNIIMGSVTVVIDLYDEENMKRDDIDFETIKNAFDGNALVSTFVDFIDHTGTKFGYVVFDNNAIIQFFNDDISDYAGNYNALPADVAKQLFHTPFGVTFCTKEVEE